MALVNIPDAAKLVRKAESTVTRAIEKGQLGKTVLQDGDIRVDTNELQQVYGRLYNPETANKNIKRTSNDRAKIIVLEERNRSLERVLVLEAELRRIKDQLTTELRARLAEKDQIIKALENRIRFLEFDQQLHTVPTLDPTDHPDLTVEENHHVRAKPIKRWWSRVFGTKANKKHQ